MANSQHENNEATIVDLIDDAIIANSNATLPVATDNFYGPQRKRIGSQALNRFFQATLNLRVKRTETRGCRSRIRNQILGHPLFQPKLRHKVVVSHRFFTPSTCGGTNIFKFLERRNSTVKELRRDNHRTPLGTSRHQLDRLTLGPGNQAALVLPKFRKSHTSHDNIIQLVQVV